MTFVAWLLATVSSDGPEVQIETGEVRGVTAGSGSFFLGLPFAAPPIGNNRWMPPQPAAPWTETLDASTFKPPCAQANDWTGQPGLPSEDCLYLDVYTPYSRFDRDALAAAKPLAVVLFIHGGGFTGGDSAGGKIGPSGPMPGVPGSERFNGTYMAAAQNVIVVSVNYRLGAFGFLGSKELNGRTTTALGHDYGTGNYGIQDQRLAMEWTHNNIHAFGGDFGRVMIHGCSAGGVSIANHLTQPLSWQYFTSAAMESGNQLTFTDALSMNDAQKNYQHVLASTGCHDLGCLLAKNTSTILTAGFKAAPVVDGINLVDFPHELLRRGRVKKVPTIIGSARDEIAGLQARSLLQYANTTAEGFKTWLANNYGKEHVARLLELYPPSSARVGAAGGDCAGTVKGSNGCSLYYYLIVTIASDDGVTCPAREVAHLMNSAAEGMAYQYSFEYPNSSDGGGVDGEPAAGARLHGRLTLTLRPKTSQP